MKQEKIKKYICVFAFSFVYLLIMSQDSYLYDVYHRCDTAWFFTCGKAWVNGLIPYVDFADSKGPLLWLIYGCGYLLNHYTYIGVFWISCFFYSLTFLFAYKTSRLYVSKPIALLVISVLPFFLFYKKYHNEVRAEDYCYTFVFICIYYVCKIYQGVSKTQLLKYSFVIGCAIMCCLLIKWSIALMAGGFAFLVLIASVKNNTINGIVGGLSGLGLVALPFLVYFIIQGNFSNFIDDYFCNTYTTVSKPISETVISYVKDWIAIKKTFILFFLGIVLFCRRFKVSYWLLFPYFCFLAIVVYALWEYYNTIVMPFSIFMLIALGSFLEDKIPVRKKWAVPTGIVVLAIGIICNVQTEKSFVFKPDKYRQSYYDVSYLMSQVKNPKVLFYVQDFGIGVLANDLPACKYWARQHGATPQMEQDRKKALLERKADFIFVSDFRSPLVDVTSDQLKSLGYVYWGKTIGENADLLVYYKRELALVRKHYGVKTLDLLLKKNLFVKN